MSRLRHKVKLRSVKVMTLILVSIISFGIFSYYISQYLNKSQAGVENSTSTLNLVSSDSVNVNNEFDLTLNILAPSDQKISSLDLYLKYDQSSDLVDFVSATVLASNQISPYFNETPVIQTVEQFQNAKVLHIVFHDQFKQNFSNYTNNIRVVYRMKAKSAGTVRFDVLKDVSGVFGSRSSSINTLDFSISPDVITKSVTITSGQQITPSPTSSQVTATLPPGTARVNLKTRFQ